MKDENLKTLGTCCAREMTVLEHVEQRRDGLIQELARTEKAIEQIKYKDLSNDTLRVLMNIGR